MVKYIWKGTGQQLEMIGFMKKAQESDVKQDFYLF